MTIPPTIQYSQIVFEHPDYGNRRRVKYDHIDELADSIEGQGMQCPLILSYLGDNKYLLEDGGRRTRALELIYSHDPLTGEPLGKVEDFTLYHAETCSPEKPGFILKGEAPTKRSLWLTELTANLHRERLDWREEAGLLVDAWREFEREAIMTGKKVYYHTIGALLGVGHSDISAAVQIYDMLRSKPEIFKDCSTILMAYKTLLAYRGKQVELELAKRLTETKPTSVQVEVQPGQERGPVVELTEADISSVSVPFSQHFFHGNSLEMMEGTFAPNAFDHIICDPDFAISVDRLESNSVSAGAGVAQESVEQSLFELRHFINLAAKCCSGYFVFFYDMDHHEKLQQWCREAGWSVQRWPLTWHKIGSCSNAAPSCNFPKNEEWAMVCHKPGTVLAKVQTTSVIPLPPGNIAKENSHPFAKPYHLWHFIYSAICSPGQHVFDPFLGSGSSVPAALDLGLVPWGCELDEQHFASATINIHRKYSEMYKGKKVVFE